MARTAKDWSLLIRAPANLPLGGGYSMYEGIIAADHWFGPLFTNIRFTRTHQPIRLRADFPLAQVQPLPRIAYADATLASIDLVAGIGGLEQNDWDDYYTTIAVPSARLDRSYGAYAVTARKRTKVDCPHQRASD
jgi:hypothetical protein